MAVLLSNFVWEGLASEMDGVSALDGHVYKQMDTGESYIHRNGIWQYINPGLAFVKATKSGRVITDAGCLFDSTQCIGRWRQDTDPFQGK